MASKHSQKDQEMAAELKRRGVKRTEFRCPICNELVRIELAYGHISFHKV